MFVRFSQTPYGLQVSLIQTRREGGKVRHEHIAGLAAIAIPASAADRVVFWRRLHVRLSALSNRIVDEYGKILAAVHERIPMPTPDVQPDVQLENAKANQRIRDWMHGLPAHTIEGHKGVIAVAERAIANGEAGAANAATQTMHRDEPAIQATNPENSESSLPVVVNNNNDKEDALKFFLSHSGLDSDRSLALQREIERQFKEHGFRVKVFNTSTVADRFRELSLTSGGDWSDQTKQYETELRRYIERNLVDSTAYILLVTPASVAANSHWIQFEIDTARSEALGADRRHGRRFFFPLLADGATFRQLPKEAAEFHALNLDGIGDWLEQLTDSVLDKIETEAREKCEPETE
jgi:hypothetical protein